MIYRVGKLKLRNRVVLVTGGSDGLGFETVLKLLCDPNIEKIIVIDVKERTEFKNNPKIQFIDFYFSNNIEELKLDYKEIDIVICNAGIRQFKSIENLENFEIMKIININWISNILLIKKYLSFRNGHVIVIGSVLGFVGPKNLGIYSGTKNGLLSMIDSLREEKPNSIFTIVLPGQLDSKMFNDVKVNKFLAPIIETSKLSKKIIEIITFKKSGNFSYPLYGRFLPIYRVLPYWLQRFCRWYSGMDDV